MTKAISLYKYIDMAF